MKRPTIHITQSPFTRQAWGGGDLSERVRTQYLDGLHKPFTLVDSEDEADVVIFWEEYQEEEQVYARKLRAAVMQMKNPLKAFVVSTEDRPVGFLPGVYTSTPLVDWSQHRFRSGGWFNTINPLIEEYSRTTSWRPYLKYSFIGANTSLVRSRLFRKFQSSDCCTIRETGNLEYNICVDAPEKEPGQRNYLQSIIDSKFVLCPRGHGTSSFRLFEAMQLGRVPVILSDTWHPPSGPAWQDFSIRIAESRIDQIPRILDTYESSAQAMGNKSRDEWESWFAPEAVPYRTMQWIWEIHLSRPPNELEFLSKWSKWSQLPNPREPLLYRINKKVLKWIKKFRANR